MTYLFIRSTVSAGMTAKTYLFVVVGNHSRHAHLPLSLKHIQTFTACCHKKVSSTAY